MIWFSAESALTWTRSSACGPIAMPATRNTATSGTRIFCASSAATVPIARTRPNASSVCLAISMEAEVSNGRLPVGRSYRLIQGSQPCADLAGGDIGLRQQPAHGEEAVELAGKMPVGHGHAGFGQAVCVFVTFVAQGIGARGQCIGRRKADQRAGARRRCLPIMDVGGAVQMVI